MLTWFIKLFRSAPVGQVATPPAVTPEKRPRKPRAPVKKVVKKPAAKKPAAKKPAAKKRTK